MPFNVVIIGSGIAGLATAIALRNRGHEITLVEATATLRPVGEIIVLQANACRMLDHLGVYGSLLPYCNAVGNGPSTRSYDDGRYLASLPAGAHEQEYGYPLWPLHRADLQKVLVEAVEKRGVNIRLGCRVVTVIEQHEQVAVVIENGERLSGDVVIGADGIDSVVRKSIAPDAVCIHDSGLDVTRATITAAMVESDPLTAGFLNQITLWCGPSTSVAAMAVRKGEEQLLGIDCCHRRLSDRNKEGGQKQDVSQLREHFKDFVPSIRTLLGQVAEARVWKLRESKPPSWVSKHGRTVVLGDAAHASLPWVGQGGGMALEDAASLAECLSWAKQPRELPMVLRAFQDIRRPRCEKVQQWSAIKGRRAFLDAGQERAERDENFKLANAWVRADPWNKMQIDSVPEFGASNWKAWLCGHDAANFAHRQLSLLFRPEQNAKIRANL